ncbi:MAG TPA: hypothetical protein VMV92_40025 [Streptosporangiaceae bacterium]|nr:hypothetical protein [Streptosporangiaceae bacterium]
MIRVSALLVALAIALLAAGVAASSLLLVYVSIGVCALAALLLAVGVLRHWPEIFGGEVRQASPEGAWRSQQVPATTPVLTGSQAGVGPVARPGPVVPDGSRSAGTVPEWAVPAGHVPDRAQEPADRGRGRGAGADKVTEPGSATGPPDPPRRPGRRPGRKNSNRRPSGRPAEPTPPGVEFPARLRSDDLWERVSEELESAGKRDTGALTWPGTDFPVPSEAPSAAPEAEQAGWREPPPPPPRFAGAAPAAGPPSGPRQASGGDLWRPAAGWRPPDAPEAGWPVAPTSSEPALPEPVRPGSAGDGAPPRWTLAPDIAWPAAAGKAGTAGDLEPADDAHDRWLAGGTGTAGDADDRWLAGDAETADAPDTAVGADDSAVASDAEHAAAEQAGAAGEAGETAEQAVADGEADLAGLADQPAASAEAVQAWEAGEAAEAADATPARLAGQQRDRGGEIAGSGELDEAAEVAGAGQPGDHEGRPAEATSETAAEVVAAMAVTETAETGTTRTKAAAAGAAGDPAPRAGAADVAAARAGAAAADAPEQEDRPAAGAQPAKTQPAKAEPGKAEPGKAEPGKAESRRTGDGDAAARPARSTGHIDVTVVPGVARYHRSGCILIRFLGTDDLEVMPRQQAEDAGFVPCRACQPDELTAE